MDVGMIVLTVILVLLLGGILMGIGIAIGTSFDLDWKAFFEYRMKCKQLKMFKKITDEQMKQQMFDNLREELSHE